MISVTEGKKIQDDREISKTFMSDVLFVSGVALDRPHPSSDLAKAYAELGVPVVQSFLDVRNIREIVRDARALGRLLSSAPCTRVIANVNGSLAQFLILFVSRMKGAQADFWVMDSYPGCLRYVTRYWRLFWLQFFCLSWLVKKYAGKIYYIDEEFLQHKPRIANTRHQLVPLARRKVAGAEAQGRRRSVRKSGLTIGVVGNIEQSWVDQDFDLFIRDMNDIGITVLVATSSRIDLEKIRKSNAELIFPWRGADTESVFSKCDFLLVPLSEARLIYSSPSKIIDCYARGIQPVVHAPEAAWVSNKDRAIYSRCIYYSDFVQGNRGHSRAELERYATQWPGSYLDCARATL